jgi:pyruvate/2-oxoglutarate dehydrogenase complex dihydrolipoamide acyltransferase (E2) component
MAQEIKIPKLGPTMTDATLVSGSIGVGEWVVEGQTICIIETDRISI